MSGDGEYGVDLDPSEAPGVDLADEHRGRGRRVERRPVRTLLRHRVVGVGRRQQPGRDAELIAGEAAVVAGAVRPFVVPGRDGGERGQHRAAMQDPFGEVRVQPNPLPLFGAERTGPIPDPTRDADPADVVHERRSTQRRGHRGRQSGGARRGDGERGDAR